MSSGVPDHRPRIEVQTPAGGWAHPWPHVADLARALPTDKWTLVGGLMTQLHAINKGLGVVRPTNDIDIILHIERERGVARQAADALLSLGYRLLEPGERKAASAHRFVHGSGATVDLQTGRPVVDVLAADHAAPSVRERLMGHPMLEVPGGTQALRRTLNATLTIAAQPVTVSVPRPLGALVMKAAAYKADLRNPQRHLADCVALLACVNDPVAERAAFTGSDLSRMLTLNRALRTEPKFWNTLTGQTRDDATQALLILTKPR